MDRSTQVRNDGQLKTKISGKIEFVDVSFSYPTRPSQIVLHVCQAVIKFICLNWKFKNISFAVTRGETVAFVGTSFAQNQPLTAHKFTLLN